MRFPLPFEVETGEVMHDPHGRWATLKLGGVEVFSELVYDTDADGFRTAKQAQDNLVRLFAERLRRVLEDA